MLTILTLLDRDFGMLCFFIFTPVRTICLWRECSVPPTILILVPPSRHRRPEGRIELLPEEMRLLLYLKLGQATNENLTNWYITWKTDLLIVTNICSGPRADIGNGRPAVIRYMLLRLYWVQGHISTAWRCACNNIVRKFILGNVTWSMGGRLCAFRHQNTGWLG